MNLEPDDAADLIAFLRDKIRGVLLDSRTYYGSDTDPKSRQQNKARQAQCVVHAVQLERWANAIEEVTNNE